MASSLEAVDLALGDQWGLDAADLVRMVKPRPIWKLMPSPAFRLRSECFRMEKPLLAWKAEW
eukprot:1045824-Amorphochlora_amoeboformis.AAC.1